MDVCQPARDIKEDVKVSLLHRPSMFKDRPERLEPPKEALNEDTASLKCGVFSANDERRNVTFRTTVSLVSQDRPALEGVVDDVRVLSQMATSCLLPSYALEIRAAVPLLMLTQTSFLIA